MGQFNRSRWPLPYKGPVVMGVYLHPRVPELYKLMCRRSNYSVPFDCPSFAAKVYQSIAAELCPYCLNPLTFINFSPDHNVPIARGGSWDLSNVDIICISCNLHKGCKTGDEYWGS